MPHSTFVEKVRRATIAIRRDGSAAQRERLAASLADVSLHQAEVPIRAFSLYFQLTNLAEEKQRVRQLRLRERHARGPVDESVDAAVHDARRRHVSKTDLDALVARLSIAPVLMAHPTEARRRTLIVALRRVDRLLDALDDARLTPSEDADIRPRLREQISLLWHIVPIRATAPGPLDEVRSVMALFDETLFVVVPRVCRALARATGTVVPPFLSFGSWIGGDRDGNPRHHCRGGLRPGYLCGWRVDQLSCRRLCAAAPGAGENEHRTKADQRRGHATETAQ